MRRSFCLLACLTVSCLAFAADEPKPVKIEVRDGDPVEIVLSKDWTHDVSEPKSPVATIRTRSAGKEASLQITFLGSGAVTQDVSTQEKVEELVAKIGGRYAEGSVEKKVVVKNLKAQAGMSALAEFTDAELVGKKTEPGKYKVMGSGVVVVGKSVGLFTLLGESFDDPSYKAGKEILIKGLSKSK